jgi:hypothetical protein
MAMTPSIQRHPIDWPTKPPTIGPITGPRNGAAAKILVAKPRWEAGNYRVLALINWIII